MQFVVGIKCILYFHEVNVFVSFKISLMTIKKTQQRKEIVW